MKVLKGNRSEGFAELLDADFSGISLHNIKVEEGAPEGDAAASATFLLLLDVGNDELVQIRLSQKERVLLNAALKSEGSWIYADDE